MSWPVATVRRSALAPHRAHVWRKVKSPEPGLTIWRCSRGETQISAEFSPTNPAGWELAHRLPEISRRAIANHSALLRRISAMHSAYRRRNR